MHSKARSRILVIDTGLGNMGSLISALEFLKFEICVVNSFKKKENIKADGFILPGVGTFPSGMKKLKDNNLDLLIYNLIDAEIPGMGICLGMQLFAEFGFECNTKTKGLNLINGSVELMMKSKNAKVPHIGWTQTFSSNNKEDWQKHLNNAFYYIHSYSFISRNEEDNLAIINRDSKKITAAIYRKKLLGLQFHPEKSQINGLLLIKDYFNYHI
jgi:glutamine amidotransferase